MWIEDIYLEDFGCYRHQKVEGLHSQLVVIGGPQRAGKTTFMRILRHLGFGLPRGGSLPPAVDEHSIQAAVVLDGTRYVLQVSGFGKPSVIPQDGSPALTAEELYGGLSPFAYHQVFTISLDELKRRPRSVTEDDEHRLQAVLLGAGWADAIRIPRIKQEFADEADRVGGKYGRAAYQLKVPLQQIREGVQRRREALMQVDEFHSLQKRLQKLLDSIRHTEEKTQKLQTELTRLHLLEEHWERLIQYREINRRLQQQDSMKVLSSYPEDGRRRGTQLAEKLSCLQKKSAEVRDLLRGLAGERDLQVHARRLVQHREAIRKYDRALSGWRERLHSYRRERNNIRSARLNLGEAGGRIYSEWRGRLDRIGEVEVDLVSRSELKQKVATLTELEDMLDAKQQERRQLQSQLDELFGEIESIPAPDLRSKGLRLFAGLGFGCLLGWLSHGWWGVWPALLLAASVVGLTGAFLLPPLLGDLRDRERRREIERLVTAREGEVAARDDAINDVRSELENAQCEFGKLQDNLGIPRQLYCEDVMEFYDRVVQLQQQLAELRSREKVNRREGQEIRQMLSEPLRTMKEIRGFQPDNDDFLAWGEDLFSAVEASVEELEWAVKYRRLSGQQDQLRKKALCLLREGSYDADDTADAGGVDQLLALLSDFCDRGRVYEELAEMRKTAERLENNLSAVLNTGQHREALLACSTEENKVNCLLQILLDFSDRYASEEEVTEQRRRVHSQTSNLDSKLEQLKDERARIRQKMEEISTDENLRSAQAIIQRGRANLRPLASRYAQLRISELLLSRLQTRFMQKAHGALLDEAGGIFRRITGEAYEAIETLEDPSRADFKAVNTGRSSRRQSSSVLSGATREQLFLAVRMARIRQIEPALPVILDDSTANFDPHHRLRTVEIIDELAQTHQVFLLTCHPEMIQLTAQNAQDVQYWYVQEGQFSGPYCEHTALMSMLSC